MEGEGSGEDDCICGLDAAHSAELLRQCSLKQEELRYRPLGDFEAEVSGVGARDKALLRWEASESLRAHCLEVAQRRLDDILADDPSWSDKQLSEEGEQPAPVPLPTAILDMQRKHAEVSLHNDLVQGAIGARHLRESFVASVIREQHAARIRESPKNPAEGKGYAEAGPPGPRNGELANPEEHRQRREEWLQEQKQHAEEMRMRDEFRAHLEVADRENLLIRSAHRETLAAQHATQKRAKIREINEHRQIALVEEAKKKEDAHVRRHEISRAHMSALAHKRHEDQVVRSQHRESQAEAARQRREEQAKIQTLQRQQLQQQQVAADKKTRALRKARKRELMAFRASQREKEKNVRQRLSEIREDQALWQMEKMKILGEQTDQVEVIQEHKKYQRELRKERTRLRHEDHQWRRTHFNLALERTRLEVMKDGEAKAARYEMMEKSFNHLHTTIESKKRQRLIQKDKAADELLLRHVTGDWTKSTEQLFNPSRCKSVPLPRCVSKYPTFVATTPLPSPGFLPPRSAGCSPPTIREKTPEEFAASLLNQSDDRMLTRMPLSRGGTPALPPLLEATSDLASLEEVKRAEENAHIKVHVKGKADMHTDMTLTFDDNSEGQHELGTSAEEVGGANAAGARVEA